MIAIAIAVAAMIAVVAIAVALAMQSHALERRTFEHTRTVVDESSKPLKREIGAARADAKHAADAAAEALDGLGKAKDAREKQHGDMQNRIDEVEGKVTNVADLVPIGLKPHVSVNGNEIKIASTDGVDSHFARGAFGKKGGMAYVRGGRESSVLAIGDRETARIELASNTSAVPVHIGANGSTFNSKDGDTIINPARDGGVVSVSERAGSEIGGFRAAGAFIKEPRGRAFVKGAASEIAVGAGVSIDASHTHPVAIRGQRVNIDAPGGLCMGDRCISAEKWRSISELAVADQPKSTPPSPPVTPLKLHDRVDSTH